MLLTACSGGQQGHAPQVAYPTGADAAPPMAQSDTGEFHHDDPCSLLTPAEVEAALGAKLGTAPFRGPAYDPNPDGSECVYVTRNFQTVTLKVDYDGGKQAYHITDLVGNMIKAGPGAVLSSEAKKAMVPDTGEALAGEWDEAKLAPMNCCIFEALRADQMITIDFTGSAMQLKQAAGLVDAAFKRIDKPLGLDGGANVAAAKAFLKTRPAPQSPCSVLSQAEVETILGKLAAPPKPDDDSCSYEVPHPSHEMPRIYELQFEWRAGNSAFRQDLSVSQMAGAALGSTSMQETRTKLVTVAPASNSSASVTVAKRVTETVTVDEASKRMTGQTFAQGMRLTGEQDSTSGPWERAAEAGPGFEAVKDDVLVKIGLLGVDRDRARALVAAAMKKF